MTVLPPNRPVSSPLPVDLRRQLSWVDAAAVFVGIILGSGIFIAPAAVAAATHNPLVAIAIWLLGGVVAACGALCYAECGARLPRTGGFYVYHRHAFGEGVAFVSGFAALVITYPASLAAIALVLAEYLTPLISPQPSPDWLPTTLAAVVLLALGAVNILGVKLGAMAQRVLTATKVVALGMLVLAALHAPTPVSSPASLSQPFALAGFSAVLTALVVMLWTYDGWSDVTLITGELCHPGRDLRRTVWLGIVVLVTLYAGVQLAVMHLLPPNQSAASSQVVAVAVAAGLGPRAGKLVSLLVVVCTFGSLNGTILTASRLGYAMAREGAFVSWLGRIHDRFATPARSIAALVAASLVYVLVADFRQLLALFSFNVWLFYGATAVALMCLRRRGVGEPLSWRSPGGWLAPTVVVGVAVGMTVGLLVQDPIRSLGGFCVLLTGVPVYLLWQRVRSRQSNSGAHPCTPRD